MRKLRILYAGSPVASAIVLSKLYDYCCSNDFCEIVGVLTNPPSVRGRHSDLIPTEVAQFAEKCNIPVLWFEHLKSEAREKVKQLNADILVCFDFGKIFGPKFLDLFQLGGINLHPSKLPKYRGCTPVPTAILNGDSNLGVSVQKLALKTDEGDILESDEISLDGTETTQSLMDGDGFESKVTEIGSKLLISVLSKIKVVDNEFILPNAKPQNGEVSYTPLIKKEDGIINWNKTAIEINRQIRAYTPWPLCFTECNGVKLLILKAFVSNKKVDEKPGTVLPYQKSIGIEIACGDGTVLVATELQWQAKKAMDYKSFMNGARNFIGSVLS